VNNPETEAVLSDEEDKPAVETQKPKQSVGDLFKERLAQLKLSLNDKLGFTDTLEIHNP
jgi:hypothetical protein